MSKIFSVFGRIKAITPAEQVGTNYIKRTIVLETPADENGYTDIFPIESFRNIDAPDKVGSLREGIDITLRFCVRGREWNGRYFSNLAFVGIDEQAEGKRAAASGRSSAAASPAPVNSPAQKSVRNSEDLPF